MKNDFNMCPMCGSKVIKNENNRLWKCPDCGYVLYCNVAAAVGVIISDKNHNILLEVRAKEPRKGYLALPGGFIDPDESAEAAVIRECKEEIGVEVTGARFVCTNPNTYEYKNVEYKTCDMFFTADLPEEFASVDEYIKTLKKQDSEVESFVSCKVETLEDIEELPLAFGSSRETLKKWIKM